MKPKSKKLRDKTIDSHHQVSSLYDFTALSEALCDSNTNIKYHNSSHVGVALSQAQDANPVQSLSKDCYDFTSLSEILNNMSKQNEKSGAGDSTRVSKKFSVKIKKRSQEELSEGSKRLQTITASKAIRGRRRPPVRVRQNADADMRNLEYSVSEDKTIEILLDLRKLILCRAPVMHSEFGS